MRAWIAWAAAAAVFCTVMSACEAPVVSRDLGARCDLHSDCNNRCLAPGERYPDGMCSLSCDRERACPVGAVCTAIDGGVCLYACDDGAACAFLGPSWQCTSASAPADPRADAADSANEVSVCLGQ